MVDNDHEKQRTSAAGSKEKKKESGKNSGRIWLEERVWQEQHHAKMLLLKEHLKPSWEDKSL